MHKAAVIFMYNKYSRIWTMGQPFPIEGRDDRRGGHA